MAPWSYCCNKHENLFLNEAQRPHVWLTSNKNFFKVKDYPRSVRRKGMHGESSSWRKAFWKRWELSSAFNHEWECQCLLSCRVKHVVGLSWLREEHSTAMTLGSKVDRLNPPGYLVSFHDAAHSNTSPLSSTKWKEGQWVCVPTIWQMVPDP